MMPIVSFVKVGEKIANDGWGQEYASVAEAIKSMPAEKKAMCLLAYAGLEVARIGRCLRNIDLYARQPKEGGSNAMADGYLTVLKRRPGLPGELPDGMVGIDGPIPMNEASVELSVRSIRCLARLNLTRLSDITFERVQDTKKCGIVTARELTAWRDQKMQRNAGLNPATDTEGR